MKIKNIFIILIALIGALAYGQEKPTIGLQSIQALNPSKDYIEAELTFQKIKKLFVDSRSFSVLDRESLGIVLDEQTIQTQITSINAQVVDQGKIIGAQYIVGGKLTRVEYKEFLGTGLIRAGIEFSIEILDTETSQTLETETFKVSLLNPKNPGGASNLEGFNSALKLREKNIRSFLNKFISKSIAILSIEEQKKGAAKRILINTGKATGAKKNAKISIYEVSSFTIGEKTTKREQWIADIKIDTVEGDELSTAIVTKGGKALLEKFNTQAKLICKSK